jgi:hypothetical protein
MIPGHKYVKRTLTPQQFQEIYCAMHEATRLVGESMERNGISIHISSVQDMIRYDEIKKALNLLESMR